ncbi:TetR/AcrR family transcriptional regulator [Paenibacillus montanisoli]|uniref:TetR/AcrR family transcriptional regulator n=1 Tax=Paenibacillus montanisoli TaxID=2081970 RepID=A0A328U4F0_9BACL|nr:TetR/AcrR family transcriptional regulator [Paenibacillus montanisoli]RAP77717.1 TetR/AcrR family transcriptional regulator [Paenibacillus montanisoli]
MTDKLDRRQLKTKQLLREAFVKLIREKGYEGITVSDLTRKANINRGTFYLHYKDVLDLRDHLKAEFHQGLLAIVSHLEPGELFKAASEGKVYDGLVRLYEYFDAQADFFEVMLGPKGDLTFARLLKDTIEERMNEKIAKITTGRKDVLVPPDVLIAYMASAQLGFVLHWLQTGRKQSPRELAQMLTHIMYLGPLKAVGFQAN